MQDHRSLREDYQFPDQYNNCFNQNNYELNSSQSRNPNIFSNGHRSNSLQSNLNNSPSYFNSLLSNFNSCPQTRGGRLDNGCQGVSLNMTDTIPTQHFLSPLDQSYLPTDNEEIFLNKIRKDFRDQNRWLIERVRDAFSIY